jgi:dCTP deaminase
MILTGSEIHRQVEGGRIRISPFDHRRVTTNSYDLTLSDTLLVYDNECLDPRRESSSQQIRIPPEGFAIEKGDFVLGATSERVGSDHYVPLLHARSSIARLGVFVHVTADLIDIGYFGRLTLQLYAANPVRLFAGMLLAQVTFWQPTGEIRLYDGKYQGSDAPVSSKAFLDVIQPERGVAK